MTINEFLKAFRTKLRATPDWSLTLFPYNTLNGEVRNEIRIATPGASFHHFGNKECQCPIQFVVGTSYLTLAIRHLGLSDWDANTIIASADDNKTWSAFDRVLRHRLLDARRPVDHGRRTRAIAAGTVTV